MKTPAPLSDLSENTPCVAPSHALLQLGAEPLTQAAKDAKGCCDLQEEGRLSYMHCAPWKRICFQETVPRNWGHFKPPALPLTSGMPLAEEIPMGTADASKAKAEHELHPSIFQRAPGR